MTSFQLSLSPNRRAAARFVTRVRRSIQKALAENPQIKQTDIAKRIGVHRSVINREIRGSKDMTLGRVAELAWALGKEANFELITPAQVPGQNIAAPTPPTFKVVSESTQRQVSATADTRIHAEAYS